MGFLLAPRSTLAGAGNARLAVQMLTTAIAQEADEIAAYLEQQDRRAPGDERTIVEQAIAQVTS